MEHLQTQNLQAGGISLPKLGLGTFRMQGDTCRAAVESALALGYRHLDTAEMYGNEEPIGAAIAASGVARKDLHVTTKVWNENLAPDASAGRSMHRLKKLRLDHVDLYLVHWPAPRMNLPAMFEALMKLKEEGRTRAIGVANFNIALLKTWSRRSARRSPATRSNTTSCWTRRGCASFLREIGSAGRLLPAGAGQGRFRRGACRHRAQAQCHRSAGRAEMAARSGRRRRDPEGFARAKASKPISTRSAQSGRCRPGGDRGLAEGQAVCKSGLCAGVGLMEIAG